jgi:FtsH-binding integral membrane protein
MKYAKAVLAIVVSAAGALVVALGTGNTDIGDIDNQSWLVALLAVLGSGGLVWLAQNGPWAPYIKTVMAFLTAGVSALVLALDDNVITQAEWLTAFSAAVVATGLVFQATNDPPDA